MQKKTNNVGGGMGAPAPEPSALPLLDASATQTYQDDDASHLALNRTVISALVIDLTPHPKKHFTCK